MSAQETICLNCSTKHQGRFCSFCGQKVIEAHERTIPYFIYQFFGSAFFLENNFLKNLWNLLARPGRLPLDFIEGRRKRWMTPFSLFLLINLFYFWYSPLTDLNLSLGEQLNQPHHQSLANHLVNHKLAKERISLEEYMERYNQKSTNYANSLFILQVPIFAAFLALIFMRKKLFYADHFIYALYFSAFILLAALLQVAIFYLLHSIHNSFYTSDVEINATWKITGAIYGLWILAHTFFSLKRTYSQKTWQACVALLPVLLAFVLTHFLYRTILFLIIFLVT